jgi:hypothetical protein
MNEKEQHIKKLRGKYKGQFSTLDAFIENKRSEDEAEPINSKERKPMNENYKKLIKAWKRCLQALKDFPTAPQQNWSDLQRGDISFGGRCDAFQQVFRAANQCDLVEYEHEGEWHLHPPTPLIAPYTIVRIRPGTPMPDDAPQEEQLDEKTNEDEYEIDKIDACVGQARTLLAEFLVKTFPELTELARIKTVARTIRSFREELEESCVEELLTFDKKVGPQ